MSVTRMSPLGGKQASFGLITSSRARRSWMALTSNRYDDESVVVPYGWNTGILPRPFIDRHPSSPILLCRTLEPVQTAESPLKWIITADYSSEPLTIQQQQAQFTPPLQRPAKISWRTNKYQQAIDKDVNGKAVINSAGDPFDPTMEVKRSKWLCTIIKNVAGVPPQIISFADGVNSAAFMVQGLSIPPLAARLDEINISELQEEVDGTGEHWQYFVFSWSFELELIKDWRLRPLDCGFRANIPGDGTKRQMILDDNQPPQPVSSPALLDGNGYKLANPSRSNAVFLSFVGYPEIDLNAFPLS